MTNQAALATTRDARRQPRLPLKAKATARLALSVDIVDISPAGVRAKLSLVLPVGTLLKLTLPLGQERHARIAWIKDGEAGCEFLKPLNRAEFTQILSVGEPRAV